MSPGAEPFENIMTKFNQLWTKYYFILDGEEKVGYHQSGEIEHIKEGMDIGCLKR